MRRSLFPSADYPAFRSKPREDAAFALAAAGVGVLAGLLFFKSAAGLLLCLPMAWLGIRIGRRKLRLKKEEELERQLRDYLLSLISFLQIGYALENAMIRAEKEISGMYGAQSIMGEEAARMSREIRLKTPPERLWQSFGDRSGLSDGKQLAQIFSIAKKQGGDYLPVLKACVRMMDARHSLKREIQTLLAGQRLEYSIMCLVPAGMLLYLNVSSPDMTRYLYEGSGPWIMAGVLLCYAAAILWGDRILEKSYGSAYE